MALGMRCCSACDGAFCICVASLILHPFCNKGISRSLIQPLTQVYSFCQALFSFFYPHTMYQPVRRNTLKSALKKAIYFQSLDVNHVQQLARINECLS
jgi:hypothetical protein